MRSNVQVASAVIAIDPERNITIASPKANDIVQGDMLTFGADGGNPAWSMYEWTVVGPEGRDAHTVVDNTSFAHELVLIFNRTGEFNISVVVSNPISKMSAITPIMVRAAKPPVPAKVVGVATGAVVALVLVGLVLTGYIGRRIYIKRATVEVANFDFVMSPRGSNYSGGRRARTVSERSAFQEGVPAYRQGSGGIWNSVKDGWNSFRRVATPKVLGGGIASDYDQL